MNNEKFPYSYITLRYVHDITTREFVNVGVVMYAPSAKFVGARCNTQSSRLNAMFPGFNAGYFASVLSHIQAQFDILSSSLASERKSAKAKSIEEIVNVVLPKDDSSLQWDQIGTGVTADPKTTLSKLFDRLVAKYEEPTTQIVSSNVERGLATVEKELAATRARFEELFATCRRLENSFALAFNLLTKLVMQRGQASQTKPTTNVMIDPVYSALNAPSREFLNVPSGATLLTWHDVKEERTYGN